MNTKEAKQNSVHFIEIEKFIGEENFQTDDTLAVEEPLEIRLKYGAKTDRKMKAVSVTMRTPGNDEELAIGFLFTEGILSSTGDLLWTQHESMGCSKGNENIITVELKDNFVPDLKLSERNFYTTSSCGVCGKGSIDSIKTVSAFQNLEKKPIEIEVKKLYQLPEKLRISQLNFSSTGGIHASGLFSVDGEFLVLREDVGRHNALDKLIGNCLMQNKLPLDESILVLSGRASFELIQKAAMAGISIVAAIGAPSSLAVQLAKDFDITLIGFLKENRMNVYHQSNHVELKQLIKNEN